MSEDFARTGAPGVAVAALAVACCAGLSILGAAIGGLATGAVLGIVAGVAVTILLVVLVAVRVRRRRSEARRGVRLP